MAVGIRCGERDTFYPQMLALTSPTNGGRSVGIVRSWTKAFRGFLTSFTNAGIVQRVGPLADSSQPNIRSFDAEQTTH
jgi:hypothetical protein